MKSSVPTCQLGYIQAIRQKKLTKLSYSTFEFIKLPSISASLCASTIYPLEPEKPGKFIMITGKPGMGKSTTALFLAQNFGFKYYEADCLLLGKNSYIPLDSKQIEIALGKQRDMKVNI